MNLELLGKHRDLLAANIDHLGYPHVWSAMTKDESTAYEHSAEAQAYRAAVTASTTLTKELHRAWVEAHQPADGAAFIDSILNPPPQ
jgi:hypothetical protein